MPPQPHPSAPPSFIRALLIKAKKPHDFQNFNYLCKVEYYVVYIMKKTFIHMLALALLAVAAPAAQAQMSRHTFTTIGKKKAATPEIKVPTVTLNDWRTLNYDTISLEPNYLFIPLIFEHQTSFTDSIAAPALTLSQPGAGLTLNASDQWLKQAISERNHIDGIRYRTIVNNPQLVKFNVNKLPEPPKQYVISSDPNSRKLTVEERKIERPDKTTLEQRTVKRHNWLHTFQANFQFSQAYSSHNWYAGKKNSMSLSGDFYWDINLNPNFHKKATFTNRIEYHVGAMTVNNDSLRKVNLNRDEFIYSSNFGYNAVKHWAYSANLQFRTQLFNNYPANSKTRTSDFLDPATLNIGLGMSYSNANKTGERKFSVSILPASYNIRYLRDIERFNPVAYGLKADHHFLHTIGSRINGSFDWNFNAFIRWHAEFYAYSNYEKQFDAYWKNTFTFYVTRHLNATLYNEIKYDKSRPKDRDLNRFQIYEQLGLSLAYRFATF